MSVNRGFPEAIGLVVADLQNRLGFGPSEGGVVLPRAALIRPGDAIPEAFRPAYEALFGKPSPAPYTVLIPAYRGYQEEVNARLICCQGTNIWVLEDRGSRVTSVYFPVGDINLVETGRVLLYSWIRLSGRTADGSPGSTELTFNTVTDYILKPVLDWVRAPLPAAKAQDAPPSRDEFEDLVSINLKMANFARRNLAADDRVLYRFYQPEFQVGLFSWLGMQILRRRADAHVVILTERELIIIQDGASRRFGKNAVYGGVWHFVPLEKIHALSVEGGQAGLLTLAVAVPGSTLEVPFPASGRPLVDTLIGRFEALSRKKPGGNPV